MFPGAHTSQIESVGNEIRASSSGVDVVGSIFLLTDLVPAEGILFAFSAYFRSDSAVWFQIWRPSAVEPESLSYQLVTELRTIPSVVNNREDVSGIYTILGLCL